MTMSDEFRLIERYFRRPATAEVGGVRLGIGDDGAIVTPAPGSDLVVAVDTLVAGRHFPHETAPADVGWKSLAVNLSDLAAMGSHPRWCILSLTVPALDETWIGDFSQGFLHAARMFDIALVGGDTTRGPLAVTVTVLGEVPSGEGLTRAGARPGDRVMTTGTLGDAALALRRLNAPAFSDEAACWLRSRLDRPAPRVAEGIAARTVASAAIDISDGLLADLGHILESSQVGATLHVDRIPLSPSFRHWAQGVSDCWELPLTGGDDYELCLCVPSGVKLPPAALGSGITEIGVIEAEAGLRLVDQSGTVALPEYPGFDHFRDQEH